MKKSLMIITEAFELGGVETYIQNEAIELTRQGWDVHLVCGRRFARTLLPDGLASLTTDMAIGPEASIHEFLDAVDGIVALARRHQVSAIHAHPFTSTIPAMMCAALLRVPFFVTLHGPSSIAGSYGAAYDFMLASLVLPAANKVIAVSEEIRSLATAYVGADRLVVQHNAVAVPAPSDVVAGDRWLAVSRLDPAKINGLLSFVTAALAAGIAGIDICGTGPAKGVLEESLAEEIASGQLRLIGSSDHVNELVLHYAGVAGMGRVALEGLVAGRPVVLVGYDGIKGVVTEDLYHQAIESNLSGRGIESISALELSRQLGALPSMAPGIQAICEHVRAAHDPRAIWSHFAEQLIASESVEHDVATSFINQLRATHPHSEASAYWSREVMDVMGRVVGSRQGEATGLLVPFSYFATAYNRGVMEQEIELLRQQSRIEVTDNVELLRREIIGMRDAVMQQIFAGIEQTRLDSRLAFTDVVRGTELKLERSMERMESEIRTDIARIAGELDHSAAADRSLVELREHLIAVEGELNDVYRSSSWALTRPLRVLKRMVLKPRETTRLVVDKLRGDSGKPGSQSSPPGFLQRAMNFIRRTARTGKLDPSDKARLINMVRTNYSAVAQNLGVPVPLLPLAPRGELEDVFVWSVIDWHFRMQRPQHLAAAMAGKGHRVFYISNNFVDSAKAGFALEALDKHGRLFQVNLHVKGAPQIYSDLASEAQVAAIRDSLAELLGWTETRKSISLVQHPYWIEPAQCLPNMRLVYDCMDHHGGFENNASTVLEGERRLVERSDLLIVTSQWLRDEMEGRSRNMALIRNATEYEHFCNRPDNVFSDPQGRKVIGYYGAIAEWFDVELVRKVAIDHPDALVIMVGRDTAEAEQQLSDVPNVRFVGEVAYKDLPYWVHGFDACLLPFQVIPLTLATNPVKVYEYLSAGKPVVSVDLPEMSQFQGLVKLAASPSAFSAAVGEALADDEASAEAVAARQAFAACQTWAHRAADLDYALEAITEPVVSVVVLCYNNLEYTQACLESLEKYSDYPNLEVIAVDNASSDATPEYLARWEREGRNRRYIANATNLGFSAGNNVGLAAATGDYLVLLNNDTHVTPGWVRTMCSHLRRNPTVGLVGPVTNNIGNEARIEIEYADMEEMIENAARHTRKHAGLSYPLNTAAFFCVMMTRAAYETVGAMDEAFGVGFFEDDDYCRRLNQHNLDVICADDVFVHHHLSASFNKLKAEAKQALFEQNKAVYEAKWGPWTPHVYRDRQSRA
ncbi:glycosyltransferase [Stenotrophomonas sp. AB1(2024)]|uniref:glycosyltransferase n=1 Tax=Stenotrophomonas sp. AB1(2024) TaxID=3132215 RepID=UPI003097620B